MSSRAIANNSAGAGGGIQTAVGNTAISNSTISGNQATSSNGGGLHTAGTTTLLVRDSTITGNRTVNGCISNPPASG